MGKYSQLVKDTGGDGFSLGDFGRLASGVGYHVTGGRVGSDYTPESSLSNVAKTQYANATNQQKPGYNVPAAPQPRPTTGGGGGGQPPTKFSGQYNAAANGGGAADDDALTLANLDAQEGMLRDF